MTVSDFEREDRYAVIKYKKLTAHQWTLVPKLLEKFDKARVDCVVVEKDWPEYNFVWLMLEHRVAGYPVPDFNAVKCAADVQAAQSELAALWEELAAAQRDADRYQVLRKVTPYRFKKMQEASVTDGGDVLYFHADRFDALVDNQMDKPTESGASHDPS